MTTDRIPTSLLTGFLGSGKTTLLNAWLASPALSDAAVIVNEFGEIGIDHALIASSSDNTIELSTGCLCCTVRGDLVDTLRELNEKRESGAVRRFTRVFIETTGLADPIPVIQALMTFPVARKFVLDRVIATVDGVQGLSTLDNHPEAVKQVGVADQIVLTKSDIAPPSGELMERLRALNPGARFSTASRDHIPAPDEVTGLSPYDPATKSADVLNWLNAEAFDDPRESHDGHHHHGHHGHHGHRHDPNRHDSRIGSFCLSFEEPLHWEHVAHWLDALVIAHGKDLLRVKGIVHVAGRDRPIVVQAVQQLFHPPFELKAWPSDQRRSQIVFITRDLGKNYVAEVLDTIRSRPVGSPATPTPAVPAG